MPHVGEHLATHVFQLVQFVDGRGSISHEEPPCFPKCRRIHEAQCRGAIAENQRALIVREAPPLAWKAEGPDRCKSGGVVDESYVRSPCQLNEAAVPFGETFGEMFAIDTTLLNNLSGLEPHLPERGLPISSCALEEEAVLENEALRESLGIMT